MPDITALGEILIDFTPAGFQNGENIYKQNPGGAPANVLATVSKYGGKAAFIGKVGKDMFGDFLIYALKKEKVDTSAVAIDENHNTTLAFVALDKNGDRSFSFYRNFGADIYLTEEEIPAELIKSSKIFHFGSLSLTDEPSKSATTYALKLAKDSGCIITFDPNYRELLWESKDAAINTIHNYIKYADIMKVSKEEAQMLGGEQSVDCAAKKLMDTGLKILLITDGANGVTYYFNDKTGFIPAIKVKAIDTTGAGDIFFGTFIYEFIKAGKVLDKIMKEDIENYIKIAVRSSGLSTTKAGAIPSIPQYEEILK